MTDFNSQSFGQSAAPAAGSLNLQELQARGVNGTWLKKLEQIQNAGIISLKFGMLKTERPLPFLTKFSILGFFFNWIYYLIKGMWKKALVILGAYIFLNIPLLIFISIYPPLALLGWLFGLVFSIYVGLAAPGDYYRHVVLKEDFWI